MLSFSSTIKSVCFICDLRSHCVKENKKPRKWNIPTCREALRTQSYKFQKVNL